MTDCNIWYFSATGQGKSLAIKIKERYAESVSALQDITSFGMRCALKKEVSCNQLILIFPVYAGTVPKPLKEFLESLHGIQTKTILLSLWGNAHKGNTLREVSDILIARGFIVNGAAALVSKHSFLEKQFPLDMPLKADLISFIDSIQNSAANVFIPSYRDPFFPRLLARLPNNGAAKLATKIELHKEKCINCHLCQKSCPTGAISSDYTINNHLCVRCLACVCVCHSAARTVHVRHVAQLAIGHHMTTENSDVFFTSISS